MKVLVIGSGGREHALVWKISQSPKVNKIFCAPGNPGMRDLAECIAIHPDNMEELLSFAKNEGIDLTVVGPEAPLTDGLVNRFEAEDLSVFGPKRNAAMIEGSKSFSKQIMEKYNVPTAWGDVFSEPNEAIEYIKEKGAPIVVKADGLAAGKGVIVCKTEKEALDAVNLIMVERAFGEAGSKIVIEECLVGEEASFLAFTDGKTVLPLPSSQDHKPIYDNDEGPNTGGMGAYSPAPIVDKILHDRIMNEIMIPVVKGMAEEECPYKGVLYAGLMIKDDQIKVLEFNARFGDPECQPLLMRVKSDIVEIMEAVVEERLDECSLEIDERATVCVVMASDGYPGSYEKGMPISGLDQAGSMDDVVVFHAGTDSENDKIVANGGRVLGVTALGDSVEQAISRSYEAVSKIKWDGAYYRKDIGKKALDRLNRTPLVGIVMGSDSDMEIMKQTAAILKKFAIPFEMTIASAHRTPERAAEFSKTARKRGMKVLIAGAGMAAHLAGAIAAQTTLPVIGVPVVSSLQGLDALLSTVQMPPGVPVATVALGKAGAKNAGLLAVQILAVSDDELNEKLQEYKKEMAASVEKKAKELTIYG
ncbi:N5-carboxyaminoimidazole ribonucleotide mutase / Phosphoribosylamine--glycine ligase [Candidatus Magnetomoraceae bacterium gMMP-13]